MTDGGNAILEIDKAEEEAAVMDQLVTDMDLDGLEFDKETGAILYRNRVVGEFSAIEKKITLNAGWCRLAGVSIQVQGDQTDRRRTVFDRPVGDHRLASSS